MRPKQQREAFEIMILTGLLCVPVFIFLAVYFVVIGG